MNEPTDLPSRVVVLEHQVARQHEALEKTLLFLDDLVTVLDRTTMGIQRHEAVELKARLAKVRRSLD